MSLENSIAALTAQAGLLLDLPQTIANAAIAQVQNVGAAFTLNQSKMAVNFAVNAVTGLDTNSGVVGSPLKTIKRAVELAPVGCRLGIFLQSDYVMEDDVDLANVQMTISPDNATRRNFSFTRYVNNATVPASRGLKGFRFFHNASLVFINIALALPLLDGSWIALPQGSGSQLPFQRFGTTPGMAAVAFWACEITVPATAYSQMFGPVPVQLMLGSTTIVGSLNGKIHETFTNTAGTAASAAGHLIMTNLATV
jgi:hypothetical protein